MVEKQRNDRERGRYFLNRRDFTRSDTPQEQAPPKPDIPKAPPEDPEIESKLQNLYDSLNTSFWDVPVKAKGKQKKEKPPKEPKIKKAELKSHLSDGFYNLKSAFAGIPLKELARSKKIAFPLVGLVAVFAIFAVFGGTSEKQGTIKTAVQGTSTVNLDKTPYKPLMPKATEKNAGVRSSLNYEPTKKVFTFTDRVNNGKGIIVSQQPFPEDYRDDPISGLTSIASNIGASEWLASSRGKVFYGKNEKGEGETAVFTYKNILVLMRSSAHVTENEWQKYVDKLDPS